MKNNIKKDIRFNKIELLLNQKRQDSFGNYYKNLKLSNNAKYFISNCSAFGIFE